jgi:hypothetical protein
MAFDTTVARRDPAASETVVARRQPEASETAVAHRDPVASETAAAKAVTSAAKTTAVSSNTTTTAAPCERDCAGRRCCYAEHDGRSCCNHLLAHFSKLLMFHLMWVTPTRPLCSRCCDWFAIAPIWKAGKNRDGLPRRNATRLVRFF